MLRACRLIGSESWPADPLVPAFPPSFVFRSHLARRRSLLSVCGNREPTHDAQQQSERVELSWTERERGGEGVQKAFNARIEFRARHIWTRNEIRVSQSVPLLSPHSVPHLFPI